jgi:hypothetical protein
MSKRTRGARSSSRNRPSARQTSAPRPVRPATEAATAVAPAPPSAVDEAPRPMTSRAAAASRSGAKVSGLLAAKAANEYVYVERDLRRISMFAAGIGAAMLVLWLLIDVTKIVTY